MDTRNTKQKEIIMNTLMHDKTHPTIQELYKKVSKKDSSIGQATVYRNVNKLLEEGKINRIPTNNNIDRYDANCTSHYHLFCTKCKRVIDVYDVDYEEKIKMIEEKNNMKIDSTNVFFEGICDKCL